MNRNIDWHGVLLVSNQRVGTTSSIYTEGISSMQGTGYPYDEEVESQIRKEK